MCKPPKQGHLPFSPYSDRHIDQQMRDYMEGTQRRPRDGGLWAVALVLVTLAMCSDNQPPSGRHTAWQEFSKTHDTPAERAARRGEPYHPRRPSWFAALFRRRRLA